MQRFFRLLSVLAYLIGLLPASSSAQPVRASTIRNSVFSEEAVTAFLLSASPHRLWGRALETIARRIGLSASNDIQGQPEISILRSFRTERVVWEIAKPELKKLNEKHPGIYEWIKVNNLGATRSAGSGPFRGVTITTLRDHLDKERADAVLDIFRKAWNLAYELSPNDSVYLRTVGQFERLLQIHEEQHHQMHVGRTGADFRRYLEKTLNEKLSPAHPLVATLAEEIGPPHAIELLSAEQYVEWYLEELQVLAGQRWMYLPKMPDIVDVFGAKYETLRPFADVLKPYLLENVYTYSTFDAIVFIPDPSSNRESVYYTLQTKVGSLGVKTVLQVIGHESLHAPHYYSLKTNVPVNNPDKLLSGYEVYLDGKPITSIEDLNAPINPFHRLVIRAKQPQSTLTLRLPRSAFSWFGPMVSAGILSAVLGGQLFGASSNEGYLRPVSFMWTLIQLGVSVVVGAGVRALAEWVLARIGSWYEKRVYMRGIYFSVAA